MLLRLVKLREVKKTISLAINANDKVLTQSADGLFANINLTWSSDNGLKLIGKGGTEIATIPAADFIKDGMLENVDLKAASAEAPVGGKTEGTFLVFTFNTYAGDKVINLDVTSLIDVYTAGNGLQLDSKEFSVKLDAATEAFLSVGANGLKLSGVQTAIEQLARAAGVLSGEEITYTAPTVSGEFSATRSIMDMLKKN